MSEYGLYSSEHERDACGVGFVANINGLKSHLIVERGIEVLKNLLHRGGVGGDDKTGDGAGILFQLPDAFLREACDAIGIALPAEGSYGVGMCFLPHDRALNAKCVAIIDMVAAAEGANVLGWRDVAIDANAVEGQAREEMPVIRQCFIACDGLVGDALERKLYVLRKVIESKACEAGIIDFYIPSFSSRTIVYKGLLLGNQLPAFYDDLRNPGLVSALAVVHQRYSTNTFPSWKLAQPFRYMAHNGEINTLRGNINHMKSREKLLACRLFGADIKKLLPVIDQTGSDSSCLDNVLELLVSAGRDIPHAMMMLVPQAWGLKYPIGPVLRGFFEYHSGLMEPWDGPAALAFTDGNRVGASLDRNGLRPARYTVLDDGFIVLASEAGALDLDPARVVEKGALRPGQIILVDLEKKRLLHDGEIKTVYARKQPYRRWVEENKIVLQGLFNDVSPVSPDIDKIISKQKIFGYTREDLAMILGPMAACGYEPVGSMGSDTPLAVLSERPQLLFSYFKQMFAQVTNPPIDSIREELVMSLMTFIGNQGNILTTLPQHSHLIKLNHPILSNEDLERIKSLNIKIFGTTTIPIGFAAKGGVGALSEALEQVCDKAEFAVETQKPLVILSDRDLPDHMVPIPSLLAVSAVNQRLSRQGIRTGAGIIIETGEAREVHHMAVLLGYGATAINPYIAFETIADMATRKVLDKDICVAKAIENYISALCKGLLKIMSKMGISTLRGYRCAQVFEIIGVRSDVVEKYFTGTASRVGGIGLDEIAAEAMMRYDAACDKAPDASRLLPTGGIYKYRKDGERHLWTPESISTLQLATRRNDTKLYRDYARMINDQTKKQSTLRGLFRFKKVTPVPLDEVEPVSDIVKRFVTSAMSFGSISREAHETLAVAMNRIGAMSNSGEGGEDPARYKPMANGDSKCSAIKQVASGRFGVTIEYLVSARELQIKIAQGAKPGEGGQLPGHKVNEEIARVRHSTPGVTLISPPPHHDIYSIEDIKQLIFDLKNANPRARVSVKLVSEVGVGTIAAGVAKGRADMILISGHDGGTGASPLSSIKHAGAPWELGLAETQQTLVLNKLRRKVRLQADGQMKTGRDVVIGALLGAEEFGFATAPLVVCGCVMMRKCHLNTCPVGVATQDPELRKRYTGRPEYVINFFRMIAEDVRENMAALGFRKMDDMIGRSDLLETNDAIEFWKAKGLDFSRIFSRAGASGRSPVRCMEKQDHEIDDVLDRTLIKESAGALESGKKVEIELPIRNVNRAVGTMLSGEIARRYGNAGLPDNTIVCRFKGAAGQSFGAFAAKGLTLLLEGESNDYLGKGLSGAKIVVNPYSGMNLDPSSNIICGNVMLYGAIAGEVYIHGRAGERFAIRNSGVTAVVEGVGDHGCEYMTGGRVAILGETGVNFGAGMSGGIAYVYDPDRKFDGRCNLGMVDLELLETQADVNELKGMIGRHTEHTGSRKARYILDHWETEVHSFVKVFPIEYRRALGRMSKEDEATKREEVVNG